MADATTAGTTMVGVAPAGIGAVMLRDGGSALAVIVAGITTLISRLALPPNLEWERARARARSMVPDRATTRLALRNARPLRVANISKYIPHYRPQEGIRPPV